MARHYETLMLARTEITNDEISVIERQFDSIINKAQGSLKAFDKWGKYRLAYPVENYNYGVYILVSYSLPKVAPHDALQEITTFLKIKCHDTVLRSVTVKGSKNASAASLKPASLDSNQASGNIDTFLKDNQMEHLLDTVDNSDLEFEGSDIDSDDDTKN